MVDQVKQIKRTQCCIVGGGPAGMMLGLLLARSGVKTIVLEKHADFFRDFRGDTIHPSTLELMDELGVLEEFLQVPHQPIQKAYMVVNGEKMVGPDLTGLPVKCPYIAMMPQWDFLNFLTRKAKHYSCFNLFMSAEAVQLIKEDKAVKGVMAETDQGNLEIYADLVVAADGRHSTVRELAGLKTNNDGVPIDVLWFRLPKTAQDNNETLAYVRNGHMMVTLNRGDYYQCALLIQKGSFAGIQAQGLAAFQATIAGINPLFKDTVAVLADWQQIKLLNVQVNHLSQWYRQGLLIIGDAAHAMSPVGGVGINLAIQDAVATANLLTEKLKQGTCILDDLKKVQARREWPTRLTQHFQLMVHKRFFSGNRATNRPLAMSKITAFILKLALPLLRKIVARVVGLGFRPEHIQTSESI